jgi:5'-deoxynucleotidase YfbR-like HD superfamily hydrolase
MSEQEKNADRILDFQKFMFEFAEIERLIYLPDGKKKDRRENNIEHSYSLAMTAWFLADNYPNLDKNLLIKYALIHDLVEIHAGDEQAVGRTKEAEVAKTKREQKALKKIKEDWHDFPDAIKHMENYEHRLDQESKFVYALDKLMPLFVNLISEGKTWKHYGFSRKDVLKAKDPKVATSPEINKLWQSYRNHLIQHPAFFGPEKPKK